MRARRAARSARLLVAALLMARTSSMNVTGVVLSAILSVVLALGVQRMTCRRALPPQDGSTARAALRPRVGVIGIRAPRV